MKLHPHKNPSIGDMRLADPELKLTLHDTINAIAANEWDACAGDDNPFISHAFLSALEDSGSASAETGWVPQHVAIRNGSGELVTAIPLYIKMHSYGEYVFDQGWADAFERAGGAYYPKLQVAVPFSPVPGPRLLRKPDAPIDSKILGDVLVKICRQFNLSSLHVTFCEESEYAMLGQAGWLQRLGLQFHWQNNGYKNFDDFLEALSSRRRKVLRRERRDAQATGLTFVTLQGSDITAKHWDAFYRFYQATVDRKWGSAYLTREFFTLLSQRLGNKIVLMIAEQDGRAVAGALNLAGRTTLYGRNWGCIGEWPFLHFELCYYRAIDYAIERGLQKIEAGAQGPHKIQRGYLPQLTYSAHWIAHDGLARAVGGFLDNERQAIRQQILELGALSPFKHIQDEG